MEYTYAYFQKSADYIREMIGFTPDLAIILGSGCGPLASQIEKPVTIPYGDIPNFLTSTVATHAGKLICGTLGGKKVVCMSGRFHSYEGYDFEQLTAPIRLFKCLGARAVILTNAAGGVNWDFKPGDIMLITDQIFLGHPSPLRGKNVEEFGPRFFDVQRMYSPELLDVARRCEDGFDLRFQEGTYFFMAGPQFETPAEIRAIRALGGDAVGMSTVTEALTAAHCGLPCLGFSVIANVAAGMDSHALTDEEVNETGNMIATRFSAYLKKVVEMIP